MEVLVLLAICCVLSGPIALIISIVALSRTKTTYPELERKRIQTGGVPHEAVKEPQKPEGEHFDIRRGPPKEGGEAKGVVDKSVTEDVGLAKISKPALLLEQRIGTRWVLIAGVITVIVGMGFFLKYAYDNDLIGPLGRVVIAAVSGLVALAVGEITRRRGYEIVAKGVTALGFAILYAVVFSACRFYGLINPSSAFVLAILVTAAAMLYAVSVNEVIVAFLSLLGGFLTPVIVSTGENLPVPLFCYVTVLSVGAMLCGYYRKWRAVSCLAFVGTFGLYTAWFEKFYRPAMKVAEGIPEQLAIALVWLVIFFSIYLVLPILYELAKKIKSREEDVLLVLANAAVTFYYFWTILFSKYRAELAFCALGLCLSHLVVMGIVIKRCKEDLNLRQALLAIGLFFLTIAIPLYMKMYVIAIAWSVEGIVLVIIGLRYRSIWTQVGGAVALALSLGKLSEQLPMHTGAFQLIFNPAFGTWCFVAAAILVCHIIYRKSLQLKEEPRELIVQILYAITVLLLMAALMMEWWWHCDYNLADDSIGRRCFIDGMMVILAVFSLFFVIRPICPRGILTKVLAAILAVVGSIFTLVMFREVYNKSFLIFVNVDFVIALMFVIGLFVGALLLKRAVGEEEYDHIFPLFFGLTGVFVLWVLLTEEIYLYWYCRNRFAQPLPNWGFLSHMYISVMWAVYGAVLMTVGFWRRIKILRYVALGLFVLLLAKVFILDTSTVKSVYRIAAFLATGVTLVGVSYLYQFLRKKGFFEAMITESNLNR